mmetsp:Transcript_29341/g.32477  ORF Transcript_29341/g.32477 Transcript_29341/m.32477 type:complete len:86 (-) Transcript_29341:539-796(-)
MHRFNKQYKAMDSLEECLAKREEFLENMSQGMPTLIFLYMQSMVVCSHAAIQLVACQVADSVSVQSAKFQLRREILQEGIHMAYL